MHNLNNLNSMLKEVNNNSYNRSASSRTIIDTSARHNKSKNFRVTSNKNLMNIQVYMGDDKKHIDPKYLSWLDFKISTQNNYNFFSFFFTKLKII